MIYFIGIKGTGMAALASMLHDLGHEVMGSDQERHFFTEDVLHQRGIKIVPFNSKPIPDYSTVIIGNAFLEDFDEVVQARENQSLTCYRYHEYLGKLMQGYMSICVSGSHGKTTTTGLLSTMLNSIKPTGYLIGDGTGRITKECINLVVEACEFRRHFLAYQPEYAIITNVEIDHVDYFKDDEDYRSAFEAFSHNVSKALVVFGDDEQIKMCKFVCPTYTYGVNDGNDYQAKNIKETSVDMSFDLYVKGEFLYHFTLPFVGRHYLWNSLGAITIGLLQGADCPQLEAGLSRFKGVKRRFVIEEQGDNIFIDDYAHHPTEVSITIDAAKKRYPDRKLVAIFKPHRTSRVDYFNEQFAQALAKADQVYLCDFTSIDDFDKAGVTIDDLKNRIPRAQILSENQSGVDCLATHEPAVYLFMSSKDIYHLAELLKTTLQH